MRLTNATGRVRSSRAWFYKASFILKFRMLKKLLAATLVTLICIASPAKNQQSIRNQESKCQKTFRYYIGYKISEAYYGNAGDKKQAIKDILEIRDAQQFLKDSRYSQKFVHARNN